MLRVVTRYAIGDVQGCAATLDALLARIGFKPEHDQLWLAGDLVARGPDPAGVLRRVRGLGDAAVCVLGNHDLNLLAIALGIRSAKAGHRLGPALHAPDRDALLDWLRERPLLHRDGSDVLVHAGLPPDWNLAQAEERARDAEDALRADPDSVLRAVYSDALPRAWDPAARGPERHAFTARALTSIRMVTPDGRLAPEYKGAPADGPAGQMPWFELGRERWRGHRIVFGHWSLLGLYLADGFAGLDSGCVYGRELTALRLEDSAVFQQARVD